MTGLTQVRRDLRAMADPRRAADLAWYFQARPGGYGAGDRFLGLRVPQVRALMPRALALTLADLDHLVSSPWHEERLLGLLALAERARRAEGREQDRLARWYLARRGHVNNWDLVDASAPRLLDGFVARHGPARLRRLARSRRVWDRRIAVMGTFAHARRGHTAPALDLAARLLHDPHDLIHKAVGWTLREVGQARPAHLHDFLDRHAHEMPRTMLRYALEKTPTRRRARYMAARDRRRRAPSP